MTDFSSVNIPPPKDWQAFERNSRVLFADFLKDPHTQANGRTGQPQHGVDIYGQRNGNGSYVGVQCKGKDGNYKACVSEKELREEVKKTENFKPAIAEFFLITTAQNDQAIQEKARLLEEELKGAGRNLRISVLGWGQLQELIATSAESIKAFSPDYTPFTDKFLDEQSQVKALISVQSEALEAIHTLLRANTRVPAVVAVDHPTSDVLDQALNEQIDSFRELINNGQPKTALGLLLKLRESRFATVSEKIKYRIIANIAAAHHRMSEFEVSADLFIEAIAYNPDDPSAISNKIVALILKGERQKAHALAVEAYKRFPDNADIAFQRLHAHADGEDMEEVWKTFSASARKRAESYILRAGSLRDEGKGSWRDVLAEGLIEFPDHPYLKAMRGEEILQRYLDLDASGLGAAGVPSNEDLRWAAEVFRDLWRESLSKEIKFDSAFAYNSALLYMFMGETAFTIELLDEAIGRGPVDDELLRLRISMHVRSDEREKALTLAEKLEPSAKSVVMRADLTVRKDPAKALDILKDRASYSSRQDVVAAATVAINALLAMGDNVGALKEVERLGQTLSDKIYYHLEKYRVLKEQGSEEAEASLDAALAGLTSDADMPTRYVLAEALAYQARYDDVVDVLIGRVNTKLDSPALRMLISAAATADRRAALSEILGSVPERLLSTPFFRRGRAALAIRMGDTKAAETEIREYLKLRPQSLHMHLQLLQVLLKQDKIEKLKEEVSRPASEFQGAPEEFINLAQFKDSYGNWREAHDLAYRTWLANQSNSAVSLRYMGVFVRPGHSDELDVSPSTIAPGMAIGIKVGEKVETFVIESEPSLRSTAFYVAPDHPVAVALLGKGVGDSISIPEGETGTIQWIKPKQLHALHVILDTFNLTFPAVGGFKRLDIDFKSEDGRKPIAERLQEQSRIFEEVFDGYSAGRLPLALTARMLGANPVDIMLGLIEQGRTILSCEGTHPEREQALTMLAKYGKKGCVVDAATLHLIRRLRLENPVQATCGPISIVEKTALLTQEKINTILENPDEPNMSLMWREGEIVRHEVSPTQKAEALRVLREDKAWIASVATIEPAKGTKDPSPEFRGLIRRFGSDFVDDILAAQGSGKILLSEDNMLRALAKNEFGVEGIWLQPVLMRAVTQKDMSIEEYATAMLSLVRSKFEFISVDSEMLQWAAEHADDIPVPEEFLQLTGALGGPKADLRSHIGVAVNFLKKLWVQDEPSTMLKHALVGRLMEQVSRERNLDETYFVIGSFYVFARNELKDSLLTQYIRGWMRGHFIPLLK